MTLVKNWNYFLCLLLNKIGLEIIFPDHPVRKQGYLDWKIRILPKGLTHDSGQKLEFFLLLAFKQNRPWNKYSGCEDLEHYKTPTGGIPQVIKLGVIYVFNHDK